MLTRNHLITALPVSYTHLDVYKRQTVGYWKDLDELKSLHGAAQIFEPKMDEARKEKLYKGWKKAVKATQVFAESDD